MKHLPLFLAAVLSVSLLHPGEAKPILTPEDRQAWVLCLKRVKMKPPCCGACAVITDADLKSLWNYLTAAPEKEPGVKSRELWDLHKDKLLEEFKRANPERYLTLYGNSRDKQPGGKK
ncbi:MAG: hypothetical protein A3A86_06630 [Elusimicrobia bacterium RIFCSPLOWO2_01_FULL_60_11]|nr:MAG: hypothetical protein A3A86_06630 [Elusimicrobia bacterium RIFCSPLOWO2_01_FULL_60_11]